MMTDQLRGLTALLSLLGIFVGMALCGWESMEHAIFLYVIFFFVCGVFLKIGGECKNGALALASLFPPVIALLYVRIAFVHFGCEGITGGKKRPDLGFLVEILVYAIVLEWLGVFASEQCRRIAEWMGSASFIRLLDKIAVRVKRVGIIFDELTRLGKLVSGLRDLLRRNT